MLLAIRHFITDWNERGLLQGKTDIPLILDYPKNRTIAAAILKQVDVDSLDSVIVSPMLRAIQSAELLGVVNFTINPLLVEISFGEYEGQPKSKMISDFDGKWESAPLESKLSAEVCDLETRIRSFLTTIDPQKNVLIISHGAFIRGLKSIVEFDTIDKMNTVELANGELIKFDL